MSHDTSSAPPMDFVIPLKEHTLVFGAVVQALDRLYRPRRIIVATDLDQVEQRSFGTETPVEYVDQGSFFGQGRLSKAGMQRFFDDCIRRNPGEHTKFGWWYQQFVKLGAGEVIDGLSEYYVVWDADFIPLVKWDLYAQDPQTGEGYACTAILQEQPFHETSRIEYAQAIRNLVRMQPLYPLVSDRPEMGGSTQLTRGTFMPFHMVLRQRHLRELFALIVDVATGDRSFDLGAAHGDLWQYIILRQSSQLSFFSEFQLYQTFCVTREKRDNRYYPYPMFGSSNVRFPDGGILLDKLRSTHDLRVPLTYDDMLRFVRQETGLHEGALFDRPVSYLVIDRV